MNAGPRMRKAAPGHRAPGGQRAFAGMGLALSVALLPSFATAQTAEGDADVVLKEAPEYFIDGVLATMTAQQLARSCPTLSINPQQAQALTGQIIEQLVADGFDTTRPDVGMIDPAEEFGERQRAFMIKHDLRGVIEANMICDAGLAEIAEATTIGRLLLEVPE